MDNWIPSSWQKKSLYQMPEYICKYNLANVVNKLEKLPPLVTVEEIFEFGKIYFAPSGVRHGVHNPYAETAVTLNIFIPPRYNVLPINERNK